MHPFIVAPFSSQSVKGNDMACKNCEISTLIKDTGVDLFLPTETWLSAKGDEAKTVELAPSGNHSHVNRDLVPVELLHYANLF